MSALQEDLIGDPMYIKSEDMAKWFGMGRDGSAKESIIDALGIKWRGPRWGEGDVERWQFCAGGLQGFVRDSEAHRLVLSPVVRCSLAQAGACIAPSGSSRANHNFDQTAFTLAIRASNFSCLPRETHCMWSVKKGSIDPRKLSTPIEVISRGHRMPKPYSGLVKMAGCKHDTIFRNGTLGDGREENRTRTESISRHSLWFKISRVYLQPIGDGVVMAWSCVGFHLWVFAVFLAQIIWLKVSMDRSVHSIGSKRCSQSGGAPWISSTFCILFIALVQASIFQFSRSLR